MTELSSPAGTVTEPAGADVSGLVGSPLSHQVTGGDAGAVVDAGPEGAGIGVGVELGAEALAGLEVAGLPDGAAVGAGSLGLVAVGEAGAGLVAVGEADAGLGTVTGAASRATVAAAGSDEGLRLHFPSATVPRCLERVAAAT